MFTALKSTADPGDHFEVSAEEQCGNLKAQLERAGKWIFLSKDYLKLVGRVWVQQSYLHAWIPTQELTEQLKGEMGLRFVTSGSATIFIYP